MPGERVARVPEFPLRPRRCIASCNSAQEIQINDVARHAGVRRHVFERRFTQLPGGTPAEEERLGLFAQASQTPIVTDMPVTDVAEAAGFGSAVCLPCVLRTQSGIKPLPYRKKIGRR